MLEEPDEPSGLELLLPLLLLGDELLPELLPEEPSEPPIPEVGLTPKYENTLCFQPGCDRSVVASNDGADCNLVVSPLKTKVCWPMLEELDVAEVLDAPELPELLGRSKLHGTATCLPELELEPLVPSEELVPLELVPLVLLPGEELPPEELLLGDEELAPEELLPGDELAPEEELSEITAHSIRPEVGLAMISLMVPSVSPEVDCT